MTCVLLIDGQVTRGFYVFCLHLINMFVDILHGGKSSDDSYGVLNLSLVY